MPDTAGHDEKMKDEMHVAFVFEIVKDDSESVENTARKQYKQSL